MVSQAPNGSGAGKSASGSGSGAKSSNTSSSKPRAQQGGISFVAFDAGISKETRKAVRVQAAKASAAARKATIARKLADRKRDEDKAQLAEKAAAQDAKPVIPAPSQQSRYFGPTPVLPDPRQHTFAALPPMQQTTVHSPSSTSSRSSKGFSDAETDVSQISRSTVSTFTHKPVSCSARSRWPAHPCKCEECKKATPASPNVASPDYLDEDIDEFIMRPDDQIETMRAIARYAVPRPATINSGRHDPFNCYPVQWQPWFDGLLHYMMTVFAPRAWPVLNITSDQGTRWEWFMTQHAMEEPALFYVRLLFASGDLIRIGSLKRESSYWLQTQAIKAINEALQDPKRSAGDGLILAVGRIALHECMYGDRNAANTVHRPAQRRMIDIRGGMGRLGFPDLVKRLMRWADRVMSMQGNTARLLPDDEDEGNFTYSLKQSVDGFEAWAPGRGQNLRDKMAIANLLTD
jgi:hypothetical protein